jgi:adenylate cyclase class IV
MRNLEFKCELRDAERATEICRDLGASRGGRLLQIDTYYRVPRGRLKRRETAGQPDQWIFYDRANRHDAKLSDYTIHGRDEAEAHFGWSALPVWLVVDKRRDLWLLGEVRIHLDEVLKLGRFFELEALVTTTQSLDQCQERVRSLRSAFAAVLGTPVDGSYSDLLAAPLG